MVATKPGRFDLQGIGPLWVLWADADNRTVVLGTPSGAYGFILNRDPSLPSDRLNAARDILAFNGYDVGKLDVYKGSYLAKAVKFRDLVRSARPRG